MYHLKLAIIGFFWNLVTVIGGYAAEVNQETVAIIGARHIGQEDIVLAAARIYGENDATSRLDLEKKKTVLDILIAAELLNLEGITRGLDRDPQIVAALNELERKLLVEEFSQRILWADLVVSEEEIQAKYQAWGSGEQVRFAHILCDSNTLADTVLKELSKGADFAALARRYSQHAESASAGGDMGYLRQKLVFPEVVALAWKLPIGQFYAEAIQTSMGYHVVKVLDRRRLSLVEYRRAIEQNLKNELKQKKKMELWKKLRGKYKLEWHSETARLMALRQDLSENQVLYSWNNGQFKAADYLRRAKIPQPVFRDTSRLHALAERLVMEELIHLEACEKALDQLEAVRREMLNKQRQLLGQRLFELEVVQSQITALEMSRFYAENADKYRMHKQLTIREILVDNLALADSLYMLIQHGADMKDLARRFTVRVGQKEHDGLWENVEPGNPASAKVYRLALEGEGLLAPVKVPGGFSLIHVLAKHDGRILEFSESEKQVREDIMTVKMDTFIKLLRRKHQNKIKINDAFK